jgi:hypothetical protein
MLKRLCEDGHFAEMHDAYRFGAALALARGVIPEEGPSDRRTVFSVGTVDPPPYDLAAAVRLLVDTGETPVYRWVERCAEWGVVELSRLAESGEIDFDSLLQSVRPAGK